MESFKEEHRNGKVFSMDIQKLKNYASKHKLKVALGTTMAAALIAGASAGTYAYFTSKATANTNLTLNKGTVTLETDDNEVKWTYLGNSTEQDISKVSSPKDDYKGSTINPDLSNEKTAIRENPDTVFTGNHFRQVVPGDTFVKTVKIDYQGNNEAELAFRFQSERQDWSTLANYYKTLANYYNLKVEYQINTGSPHQLIANDSDAATLAELISETGKKISETVKNGDTIQMNFYAQLKAKDYDVEAAKDVVNFDTMSDLFEVRAKNKLYPKTSSDSK